MDSDDLKLVLNELKAGRLVFMADNTLLSWYIRKSSGSFPFSHVAITDGKGNLWTTSAKKRLTWKPPFVRFEYGLAEAGKYLADKTAISVCEYDALNDKQVKGILEYCATQVGTGYPVMKLLRMILMGQKGQGVDCTDACGIDYTPEPRDAICTEGVVAAYLFGAGVRINQKAGNTNPSGYDLVEVFYGEKVKEVIRVFN